MRTEPRRLRRRAALWVIALAGATSTALQAETPLLTLDAAIERAGQTGPALAVAEAAADVARANASRARRPANPELTIEAENVLGRGAYRDFDAAETTVSLQQALPVGGKRRARIDAAEAGLEGARFGVELAARETRRDVTIAYARVLLADRLAALARGGHQSALALRDATRRRVAVGLESELQLARAEVEATASLGTLNRAQSEVQIARRGLGRWLAVETVPDRLDDAWFDRLPASVDAAAFEVEQHPRLRQQRAHEKALESRAALARREALPDPTLSLGVRRFADALPGDDRALTLGVSVPLPLWDRNGTGIAEARGELVQARVDAADARRELSDAFATSRATLLAAKVELEALNESGLPAARSAAALAARGHEAGRLSLLERLAAERALREVEEAAERARYAAHESAAQLDYLGAGSSSAP
jgi:cobalt-zinc-cadmium efflux system outer membrane protein